MFNPSITECFQGQITGESFHKFGQHRHDDTSIFQGSPAFKMSLATTSSQGSDHNKPFRLFKPPSSPPTFFFFFTQIPLLQFDLQDSSSFPITKSRDQIALPSQPSAAQLLLYLNHSTHRWQVVSLHLHLTHL